jgi:guanyl-specific ribonuclease Sa
LDKVAPGKSIGGDHFGNFEHQVPDKKGRHWKECDIDYVKGNRGPKRIVFSDDGLVYYSGSHYRDFVKLY